MKAYIPFWLRSFNVRVSYVLVLLLLLLNTVLFDPFLIQFIYLGGDGSDSGYDTVVDAVLAFYNFNFAFNHFNVP